MTHAANAGWTGHLVAIPAFDAAEREHGLATFAAQRVVRTEDGAHVLAAWRAEGRR